MKTKYWFTLTDLHLDRIHIKYGLDNIQDQEHNQESESTTKLSDLNAEKNTPVTVSFLDESKRPHICHVSMIDFKAKMDVNLLRYHCFWCRNPFDTKPIGCPIKYVSNSAIKKYHSYISRDTYTINENITHRKKETIKSSNRSEYNEIDPNVTLSSGSYYETDGVFCSFNCCKAYIADNKHNRLYDHSDSLLVKMYNTIMDSRMVIITPAPHWRTLEHYGGHLNIIQFRESFNKVDYEYHGCTKSIPNFAPLGNLYEEKIKF